MINVRFLILAGLACLFAQSIGVKVRSLQKHCWDSGFFSVCTNSIISSKRGFCSGTISCAVKVNNTIYKQANGAPPENTPCGNLKACKSAKCEAVTQNPEVVGPGGGVACSTMVPVAHKINARIPPPLSP